MTHPWIRLAAERRTQAAAKSAAVQPQATTPAGQPPTLGSVYTQYHPLIQKTVQQWSGSGLPAIVLEAEAKRLVAHGLKTYDPSRKTNMSTHLMSHLRQMDVFVNTYGPAIRVPQDRALAQRRVGQVTAEYENQFNRAPTPQELSARLGVPVHNLGSLQKQQVSLYSKAQAGGFDQPIREDISAHQIALDYVYFDLPETHKKVFAHSIGYKGAARLSPGEMATQLGLSPARISQIKADIAERSRKYGRAVEALMR
jgi:DNA-directed RNA polymerase specialized sigma subunit